MKHIFTSSLALIACGLLLVGCKKESPVENKDQTPTNPAQNASGQPGPSFSNVANFGGMMATISFEFTAVGIVIPYTMGFAQFGSPNGVDVGTVTVNSNTLSKETQSSNTFYSSFSSTNPSSLSGVNFNGSSHSWSVSGGSGVPALTASVTSPSTFTWSAPASGATITKASGLTLTWTGTSTADSMMVVLYSATGAAVKQGLPNNGSATLSSSEISAVSGDATLQLVKYRYALSTVSGKTYVVFAEIVKTIQVKLQ